MLITYYKINVKERERDKGRDRGVEKKTVIVYIIICAITSPYIDKSYSLLIHVVVGKLWVLDPILIKISHISPIGFSNVHTLNLIYL